MTPRPTPQLFSVDVEEYFQVTALEHVAPRDRWPTFPARVEASVHAILELLDRRSARGTFFTLGWIAKHRPDVVRAIADAGHEIASHGYWHQRVTTLTPEEFREDVRTAKDELEQLVGRRVLGYRAPSFSITPRNEWALDVLAEQGYRYDSSRFPIRRPDYGSPNVPRVPHTVRTQSGELLEIPLATTLLLGAPFPAAGGGYLRQFPFSLIRRAFRESAAAGVPAMFYVHPWEVDPGQPRLPVSLITRVRHYRGLARTLPLMDRLLAEFPFTSVDAAFPDLVAEPAA
jgi:polysaccharide deacetylase family protein (PEP-CTERM system associated)